MSVTIISLHNLCPAYPQLPPNTMEAWGFQFLAEDTESLASSSPFYFFLRYYKTQKSILDYKLTFKVS